MSKVPWKVKKTLNFDGLEIEIIDKSSPSQENKPLSSVKSIQKPLVPPKSSLKVEKELQICSICLNFIEPTKEVVLKCQDVFCMICLVAAIINNENDVVTCPSRMFHCNKAISDSEIEEIIGEENFRVFTINRLQRRLDKLEMRFVGGQITVGRYSVET
jgi:hypothetical protein